MGFKRQEPNFAPAPGLRPDLRVGEINVAVATHHFFNDAYSTVEPCEHRGRPLVCRYGENGEVDSATADALWFHG